MRVLTIDGMLYRGLHRTGSLAVLSLCWVVTSVPIITLFAATAALVTCFQAERDDGTFASAHTFISAFIARLRTGVVVFLVFLAWFAGVAAVFYAAVQVNSGLATVIGSAVSVLAIFGAAAAVHAVLMSVSSPTTARAVLAAGAFLTVRKWRTTMKLILLIGIGVIIALLMPDSIRLVGYGLLISGWAKLIYVVWERDVGKMCRVFSGTIRSV